MDRGLFVALCCLTYVLQTFKALLYKVVEIEFSWQPLTSIYLELFEFPINVH